MFEQLQKMMATPQAREMVFKMMAQQVAQAPPEKRAALARVTVTLERSRRGMHLDVGYSDDEQIEAVIKEGINHWTEMLSRGFQAMGFKVEIVE